MRSSGFGKLRETLDQLGKFTAELDGELTTVTFDPTDPGSLEAAISQMSDAIDAKADRYPKNEMIRNLAEQAKESFRERLLERAAAARTGGGGQ